MGLILATNCTENRVLESIGRMRAITSEQAVVWKTRVREDNKAYLSIIGQFSHDISATIAEIDKETGLTLGVLQKLDPGGSWDDVNLIANARWIRGNAKLEPFIISDDRDLLTCGHILSSFFGLTLGFLSSFEILRLMELDEPFVRYCSHYSLSKDLASITSTWSKEALEREICDVMRKSKIACHPSLRHSRGTKALLRIIRR